MYNRVEVDLKLHIFTEKTERCGCCSSWLYVQLWFKFSGVSLTFISLFISRISLEQNKMHVDFMDYVPREI